MLKRAGYILYVIVVVIIGLEVFLRFYDPFPSPVRGDELCLVNNRTIVYPNPTAAYGLDTQITVIKNSMGFRGPEWPHKPVLKLLTVGGSTTECIFITEGKTWTDVLRQRLQTAYRPLWVNNAGIDGQSTYGHLVLLQQHILKLQPDVCVFLTGCNDVGRTDLNNSDSILFRTHKSWKTSLARYSKLFNTMLILYRNRKAVRNKLTHDKNFSLLKGGSLNLPDAVIDRQISLDSLTIQQYGKRLQQIIALCRQHQIEPVFVTQPCLAGEGKDELTGVDLGRYRVEDGVNGKLLWKRLEAYNAETKRIAAAGGVPVIDLAHQLPKSSRYFYDLWHYNNTGCVYVGNVVARGLAPVLHQKFP